MTRILSDYPPPGMELRLIDRFVDLRGRRILEIGSGEGRLTREIASRSASVVAIEPDAGRVAFARKMAAAEGIDNAQFRIDSAETLDLGRKRFDVAIFSWSL